VPGTPMIAGSDVALYSEFAQEESVAQTRSFSSMAVMVQILAGLLVDDTDRIERLSMLPSALEGLLAKVGDLPKQIGQDLSLDRFFFLGSGPFYGIACEMMLKTKEMTVSWCEAYHPLEFRHGPMALAAPGALIAGLISDSQAEDEIKVLREMKAKGARTLAICENKGSYDWDGVDIVVETNTGLSEWVRPVLYLPPVQWMAFHRAVAKGLDPDNPTNLTQVVELSR
jgi:glucosamine--fructose-6-phosphate aminotransferase (isomerizing)